MWATYGLRAASTNSCVARQAPRGKKNNWDEYYVSANDKYYNCFLAHGGKKVAHHCLNLTPRHNKKPTISGLDEQEASVIDNMIADEPISSRCTLLLRLCMSQFSSQHNVSKDFERNLKTYNCFKFMMKFCNKGN